jgi:hypothetical protein
VPGRERRFRDGRLGPRSEGGWQGAHDCRRRCAFAKATGLTLDLNGKGLGLRSNRSMLVKDGKVATLNVEAPGKFEVSDAGTMLAQAKQG